MRTLFGPDHDGLHIDPNEPDGYEWWYFDAISADRKYALVAIFFIGSPMSPYYREVETGKKPLPCHWCGVYFTLHERKGGRLVERGYTYNLYIAHTYSEIERELRIGGSALKQLDNAPLSEGTTWWLEMREPGLWAGKTTADLDFHSTTNADHPAMGEDDGHTWVCTAPRCHVKGRIKLPSGAVIPFDGSGYHDHNFGKLPWNDIEDWHWGRAMIDCGDDRTRTVVLYNVTSPGGASKAIVVVADSAGHIEFATDRTDVAESRQKGQLESADDGSGLEYVASLPLETGSGHNISANLDLRLGVLGTPLSLSPFYRRQWIRVYATFRRDNRILWKGKGDGIGEVFCPEKLGGLLVSQAIRTRLRGRR